jgi:inosine-uridine nucleoside N-ribohydrolase
VAAHDPAAMIWLMQPDLFQSVSGPVVVDRAGLGRGKTWLFHGHPDLMPPEFRGRPGVTVPLSGDHAGIVAAIVDLLG